MIYKAFCDWIKRYFIYWQGGRLGLPLEAKIFHVFSLIAIIAAFFTLLLNVYSNIPILAYISLSVLLIQSFLFYLSRFKQKLELAITISAIKIHALLAINYFFNQGIKGPTLLLYAVSLFFVMAVSNRSWLIYILIGNALIVSILLTAEYLSPHLIIGEYPSKATFFVDTFFTYIITVLLIYAGTGYLLKSYVKQRKVLQEKANALERTNNEKIKLFSIISHDFRTPLADVQQYLEMMTSIELNEQEKKIIENKLLDITRNAQELLTNLLLWSKNQMEGLNIDLRPINLKKEVLHTIEHMHLIASKKEIKLEVNIACNISIVADPDMLNLVLRNLLYNAIKFSPISGLVLFIAQEQENGILISIEDSGKGIPLEKQKQLFNSPTKSTSGTNNEKGTGIGLMLCHEYTLLQQGDIWFETEEDGTGTTFYLLFPSGKPNVIN